MYDEICVKTVCFQNELLHFEDWNFGQFLRVDKTSGPVTYISHR